MAYKYTYDELMAVSPECVVLMKKEYMYAAHYDAAKVLSYLMEYKLIVNREKKVTCAGPDKEKIIAVLSAHHVDYLVSEFGEITAKQSFVDNGFSKYLGVAKDLPIQEGPPVVTKPGTINKALIIPDGEKKETSVPEWLRPGLAVQNRAFGVGIVESVENKRIQVSFPEVGLKTFVWPNAFERGFLETI